MIKRELSRKDNTVKLTFIQPANGRQVSVLGDFNNWDPAKGKLVKRANGTASYSVTLPAGAQAQFRYRTEDGVWFNDEGADAFAPNEFGEVNSVVIA